MILGPTSISNIDADGIAPRMKIKDIQEIDVAFI